KLLGETSRTTRPEVEAAVRHIASGQLVGGLVAALTALRDRPDATPGLAGGRVPTLVIVGAEDGVTPPEGRRRLRDATPGCAPGAGVPRVVAHATRGPRREETRAAGPWVSREAPPAFNAAVRRFLDAIP